MENHVLATIALLDGSFTMKGALSLLTTAFVALFGVPDLALKAFLILMLLDILSKILKIGYDNGGLIRAVKIRKLSSRTAINRTIYKFARYALVLAACNQIAVMIPMGVIWWGYPVPFLIRMTAYIYAGWAEFISILENLVGVDGGDLQPALDGAKRVRTNLVERVAEIIGDKIAEALKGRKGNDEQ